MSIRNKLHKSLRLRGIGGTMKLIARWPFAMIVEHQSAKRRNQIQAVFDQQYGTDTGGVIPLSAFSIDNPIWIHGCRYGPTSPQRFRECLSLLPIGPHEFKHYTFIDFGSGKGATLLYAADLAFGSVLGVELVEDLHRIAERNIVRYPAAHGLPVRSVCADATTFPIPSGPLVIFASNPFSQELMDQVLANIESQGHGVRYIIHENSTYRLSSLVHGRSLELLREIGGCRVYRLA